MLQGAMSWEVPRGDGDTFSRKLNCKWQITLPCMIPLTMIVSMKLTEQYCPIRVQHARVYRKRIIGDFINLQLIRQFIVAD